jgi:hypothetical protein
MTLFERDLAFGTQEYCLKTDEWAYQGILPTGDNIYGIQVCLDELFCILA